MKCPECNEKLVDYLYEDLSAEEKGKMDEHFKTCEHCAKQLSQFQLVRTSFQQLKKQEPRFLVHQRILAHAKEIALQQRRSWLTQLLFKPSTATVMVVLLAIGIFYYARQFIPLGIDNEKLIVKEEKSRESGRKKAEATLSTGLSSNKSIEEDSALTAKTPAGIPPIPAKRLVAESRPSAVISGGVHPAQQKALIQMAGLPEGKTGDQEPSIPSRDVLYAFELGNLYFSQREFEKATATYSIALMMNPQKGYADTIRYQLALSYKKLNDCKSAVKVLDDIQKRRPHHPNIDRVIIMAGDCYMDLHAYDKAEINYTNFIHKYPDRKEQVADKLEIARKFRRVNMSY